MLKLVLVLWRLNEHALTEHALWANVHWARSICRNLTESSK